MPPGSRRRRGACRTGRWLGGVAAAALVLAGCGTDGDDAPPPVPPTSSEGSSEALADPDLAAADLWMAFEDSRVSAGGGTVYADEVGGDVRGTVVTASGGEVEEVDGPDGGGTAVGFPPLCRGSADCPRAMVEIESDPALDPGDRDFAFGATVWLAPEETTSGSNIVQKGRFGSDGGQWKLQVDDEEGRPSCVVRSGADVRTVRAEVSIADSAWHRVVCVRDERGIGILVDGAERRSAGATGSVENEWPIRIGSPGVGADDDQFHGRVDDVFLTIVAEG